MTTFHRYKGKTLLHPDDLPFLLANIQLSFTNFRKKIEKQLSIRPLFLKPQTLQPLKTHNGLLHFNDSTKFSFYLSHGNASPRVIYHTLQQYEQKYEKNESTYWIFSRCF